LNLSYSNRCIYSHQGATGPAGGLGPQEDHQAKVFSIVKVLSMSLSDVGDKLCGARSRGESQYPRSAIASACHIYCHRKIDVSIRDGSYCARRRGKCSQRRTAGRARPRPASRASATRNKTDSRDHRSVATLTPELHSHTSQQHSNRWQQHPKQRSDMRRAESVPSCGNWSESMDVTLKRWLRIAET